MTTPPADTPSLLSAGQVAALLGIEVNTWHSYVARDQAPGPDDHVGRTPVWYPATIEEWQRRRRFKPLPDPEQATT